MRDRHNRSHRRWPSTVCAAILLAGCLALTSRSLTGQSIHASVWPSGIDHSLESTLQFQTQSRFVPDANIEVNDDIQEQQIARIELARGADAAPGARAQAVPASIDQEAEEIVVKPLNAGADAITGAAGSSLDFVLIAQLSRAVKPDAFRIASAATGAAELESIAFRNLDGTQVLFTVNRSDSPMAFEVHWKDRLAAFSQAGRSIALLTWDPKSQLISLSRKLPDQLAGSTFSVEARCSSAASIGVDLRCESRDVECSVYPVRLRCDSQQNILTLNVTVSSSGKDESVKKGVVTILAVPDAGELTSLKVPCCKAE